MTESPREFVVRLIEKKVKLPEGADIGSFNYIDSGHVDSIGIMKFVVAIEAEFDIEITEADMESQEFRTVGGLAAIISRKMAAKG